MQGKSPLVKETRARRAHALLFWPGFKSRGPENALEILEHHCRHGGYFHHKPKPTSEIRHLSLEHVGPAKLLR